MTIISTETEPVGTPSPTTASASLPLHSRGQPYHLNAGSDTATDNNQPTERAIAKVGPDISKTNWKFWSSEHLKSLVSKAKGSVSDAVLAFIKSTMKDTKLIFVMGQSGTGKSSLLNELTGMDLSVGKSLKSGTRQYHICPAVIDDQQYLFIDTAGFGAADLGNEGNFQDIMACLSTLRRFVTVAGVLFVYGPLGRLQNNDLFTLRWIQCFCGPQFFQNITIVTTKWDALVEKAFKKSWALTTDFENDDVVHCLLNPPGRLHGATIYHHGLPGGTGSEASWSSVLCNEEQSDERGDELRDLIRRKYASIDISELQVIRELTQGRGLWDTEAARVLVSDLQQTMVEVSEENATLVPRLASTTNGGVLSPQATVDNPSGDSHDSEGAETRKQPGEQPEDQANKQANEEPTKQQEEQPKKSPKSQANEQPSWFQRWFQVTFDWFTVLRDAARFFAEAREKGYQSSNHRGSQSAPAWSPWKAVRDWWYGPSA